MSLKLLFEHGKKIVLVLLLMASTVASARTESLRWTHVNPSDVLGFKVHWGLSSGVYESAIWCPPLQPDIPSGIYRFDIVVPDDATVYVVVTAYNAMMDESVYSNEGIRSIAPGKPGTPYVILEPEDES